MGAGKPVDCSHPCIAALKEVVEQEDPGRRFIPSSASGPRFTASREDNGFCYADGEKVYTYEIDAEAVR